MVPQDAAALVRTLPEHGLLIVDGNHQVEYADVVIEVAVPISGVDADVGWHAPVEHARTRRPLAGVPFAGVGPMASCRAEAPPRARPGVRRGATRDTLQRGRLPASRATKPAAIHLKRLALLRPRNRGGAEAGVDVPLGGLAEPHRGRGKAYGAGQRRHPQRHWDRSGGRSARSAVGKPLTLRPARFHPRTPPAPVWRHHSCHLCRAWGRQRRSRTIGLHHLVTSRPRSWRVEASASAIGPSASPGFPLRTCAGGWRGPRPSRASARATIARCCAAGSGDANRCASLDAVFP